MSGQDIQYYNESYIAQENYLNENKELNQILSSYDSVISYIPPKNKHPYKMGSTPIDHWNINRRLCNCWTWHKFSIQSDKCGVCVTWAPIPSDCEQDKSFPAPPSY